MKARRPKPFMVPCGADVDRTERLKWLSALTGRPFLSLAAKALAARLMAKYADRQGVAYPSIGRLARDLGVSLSTMNRTVAELHRAGFIDIVSGKKGGRPNHYTLTWPASGKATIIRMVGMSPMTDGYVKNDREGMSPVT
jgi:DNA-binding MarR family transcriptional regulator